MGNLSWMLIDLHKRDCGTPTVRRLYVRGSSTKSKQKFVPYGVICCCCGVIEVDQKWIIENENKYEKIKRRIPRQRRKKVTR